MKKLIFTSLCVLAFSLFSATNSNGQCLASFTVYPDTTLGAPLHTYLGENNCQPQNALMLDTVNYSYTWTWGDGTATTAPWPSHTYATTGNYTICLYMNATNPAGCTDSMCINAVINKNAAMAYITIKNPYLVAGAKDVTENQLSIFPNPVGDRLFIRGLSKQYYKIAIFSIEGKMISQPELNNEYVAVGELVTGNYILKVTGADHKTNVLKFFKN